MPSVTPTSIAIDVSIIQPTVTVANVIKFGFAHVSKNTFGNFRFGENQERHKGDDLASDLYQEQPITTITYTEN
jgi:hypothetical protein